MTLGKSFSDIYKCFLTLFRTTHYNLPKCPGCASLFLARKTARRALSFGTTIACQLPEVHKFERPGPGTTALPEPILVPCPIAPPGSSGTISYIFHAPSLTLPRRRCRLRARLVAPDQLARRDGCLFGALRVAPRRISVLCDSWRCPRCQGTAVRRVERSR